VCLKADQLQIAAREGAPLRRRLGERGSVQPAAGSGQRGPPGPNVLSCPRLMQVPDPVPMTNSS
jgi:hypothetical protein